jgi:hypothetical protein
MDVHANCLRSILSLAGVAPILVLAGCTHETVIVKEQDLTHSGTMVIDLLGIPFYSKKGVCNKESVWLEPQYTLTLTVVTDGHPPMTRTMVLSRFGYEASDTQDLLQGLTGLKGSYKLTEIVPESCPSSIGCGLSGSTQHLRAA